MYGESQAAKLALKQVGNDFFFVVVAIFNQHKVVVFQSDFLLQVIEQESVKGFPEVVVGTNVSDCISHVIQVFFITHPGQPSPGIGVSTRCFC